jgi:hypothetical protein
MKTLKHAEKNLIAIYLVNQSFEKFLEKSFSIKVTSNLERV